MGIQTIIDGAVTIDIMRSKVATSTVSRSGRYKTGQLVSNQPFQFNAQYRPQNDYANSRSLLEEIDRLDVIYSEAIDIGATNTNLSWITAYQGDLSASDLGNITTTSTYSGQTMDLDISAVTGGTAASYVFKKGDYIQFAAGYRYPYTVTADVQKGSGTTVTVSFNRPIIEQSGYTITGQNILAGSNVTWTVKMLNKPSYTLIPERRVEFAGGFSFIEIIGD